MGTFDIFDHTADVGLMIRAASLPDLLETASRAAFGIMILDLPREVAKAEEVAVEVREDLADDLGERQRAVQRPAGIHYLVFFIAAVCTLHLFLTVLTMILACFRKSMAILSG